MIICLVRTGIAYFRLFLALTNNNNMDIIAQGIHLDRTLTITLGHFYYAVMLLGNHHNPLASQVVQPQTMRHSTYHHLDRAIP